MRTTTPTIDDLITRGIPGVILFLALSFEFLDLINNLLGPNAQLVIVLTGSYTTGTFIDVHKHDIFSPPPYFRKVLYRETNDEQFLRVTTRVKLRIRRSRAISFWNNRSFLPSAEDDPEYGIESVFSKNSRSLKHQLEESRGEKITADQLSEAWVELEKQALPELGRTGKNHHTVYHFVLNLALGLTFASLLLIYPIYQGEHASAIIGVLAVAFMVLLLIVEMSLIGSYGTRYAKSLVQGAYAKYEPAKTPYLVSS